MKKSGYTKGGGLYRLGTVYRDWAHVQFHWMHHKSTLYVCVFVASNCELELASGPEA